MVKRYQDRCAICKKGTNRFLKHERLTPDGPLVPVHQACLRQYRKKGA